MSESNAAAANSSRPTPSFVIPDIGLGTWAWGDRWYWGYGRDYDANDLRDAFQTALDAGLRFFDTAEIYGRGESERLLGRFEREMDAPVAVGTKFFPYPWRLRRGELAKALRGSLSRLGRDRIDLYQIHWPWPPRSIDTWVDALADVAEQGLAAGVGVSNYSADQLKRAADLLEQRGLRLVSNQVQFSLLERAPERNGVLEACRQRGIRLIAYSPLAQGLLTGKYGPGHAPSGVRWFRTRWRLSHAAHLTPALKLVGERRGKSAAQVALNWLICKGATPIPGVKQPRHVQEAAGAVGWRLDAEEMAALEAATSAFG